MRRTLPARLEFLRSRRGPLSTRRNPISKEDLRDKARLPDGIVLDLDLGYDSGYELLRFWHSTPALSKIPLIVWSVLGEEQRGMCNLFKVNCFVGKWEGAAAFRDALGKLEKQTGSE